MEESLTRLFVQAERNTERLSLWRGRWTASQIVLPDITRHERQRRATFPWPLPGRWPELHELLGSAFDA